MLFRCVGLNVFLLGGTSTRTGTGGLSHCIKLLHCMSEILCSGTCQTAHHCTSTSLLRSSLPENLVLGKGNAPDFMQVCWVDQTQYPEDTIESFVQQSSMGRLCPPAKRVLNEMGCTSKLTSQIPWWTGLPHRHTHSHLKPANMLQDL